MLFVGVDAHKVTFQVTVVNSGGQILKRQRIPISPEGFVQALGGFDQPLKAVLEASYCWGPTFDWLDDLCAEVVLAHPGKVRVIVALLHNSGRVTDRSQSCLNAIEFALTQACPGLTYDSVPHI